MRAMNSNDNHICVGGQYARARSRTSTRESQVDAPPALPILEARDRAVRTVRLHRARGGPVAAVTLPSGPAERALRLLYARCLASAALAAAAIPACGDRGGGVDLSRPVQIDVAAQPPGASVELQPVHVGPARPVSTFNDRVVPYDLNTRAVLRLRAQAARDLSPRGAAATFDPEAAFDFPVGTALIKNFYFPADRREPGRTARSSRRGIAVRVTPMAGTALPYIWDEAQQDALLALSGEVRSISFLDRTGRVASRAT